MLLKKKSYYKTGNISINLSWLILLQVNIRKSVKIDEETDSSFGEKDSKTDRHGNQIPIVRKSKLLIVDLAGSERIDKSGLLFLYSNLQVHFDFFFEIFTHRLFLGRRDIVVMWWSKLEEVEACNTCSYISYFYFCSFSRLINIVLDSFTVLQGVKVACWKRLSLLISLLLLWENV